MHFLPVFFCDKILQKKQAKEGRAHFGSQSESTVHQSREDVGELFTLHPRKRVGDDAAQLAFSFTQVRIPAQGFVYLLHSQCLFPPQFNLYANNLIDTPQSSVFITPNPNKLTMKINHHS